MVKTCILYGRVSSRQQADRGLSLPGQLRELRQWAERNGYRVLAEVQDTGGKDSKRDVLDRPGINEIMDIVERSPVDIVAAQARDRFGEHPIPDFLAWQLSQHDTQLYALDSTGEGEDGELGDLLRGWMAKRERKSTAKRSRSKKLELARQGWVVATHTPPYGFRYAGDKKTRTLEIEPQHMKIVERIARMIAVEGMGVRTVVRALNAEGAPTPPHPTKKKSPEWGPSWNRNFIRAVATTDVYKAHTPEEIAALVQGGFMGLDVAARLDPDQRYGIWWYRGRDYDGVLHQVAVPVLDCGIPREWIDVARKVIESNVNASSAGDRDCWELSGGFLYCAGCGYRMQTHAVKSPKHSYANFYYRCASLQGTSPKPCPANVRLPAERTEEATWRFTTALLTEPDQLLAGLDKLIARERGKLRGDPEAEVRHLYSQQEALSRRRGAYQDQQAAGFMTIEELGYKLQELRSAQEVVERGLESVQGRSQRLYKLEDLKDRYERFFGFYGEPWDSIKEWAEAEGAPLDEWTAEIREEQRQAIIEQLNQATPEERRDRYKELELRVMAYSKEELEVSGVFGTERLLYTLVPSSTSPGR